MNKDIISKFLITNNKNQKRHPKVQKKNIYKEASYQKFYKNRFSKSMNFDSKYNFKIFKNQKSNSKKTP